MCSPHAPGRCWRWAPAPHTAASTRWKATPPAAWDCPTTSDGSGDRNRGCPSCACRAVRRSPTTSPRRILYLLRQIAGRAPAIPLDEVLRPAWLFSQTAHEGCDRGGYYEQADFADEHGQPSCIVKLGCWGPVVQCNVGKRGWMGGVGGCANVGGICIGCTMPGFPDKFQPFMNQPPGSLLSSQALMTYGKSVRALRRFTQDSLNEPRRPPRTGPGTPRIGDATGSVLLRHHRPLPRPKTRCGCSPTASPRPRPAFT